MAAQDPSQWPDEWKSVERKAFPRFESPSRITRLSGARRFERRSVREFSPAPVTHEELGVAFSALRIVASSTGPTRDAPSAGALFPVESYFLSINSSLSQSAHYYDAEEHRLVETLPLPRSFCDAPHDSIGITDCPGVAGFVLMSAVLYRTMRKYGSRGYRYALLEAGACGSALDSAARLAGLSSVWLGGFDDQAVAGLVGIRPAVDMEVPLVLIAIGHAAE